MTTPSAVIAEGGLRPQRADARRNRGRVLDAARAAFAEQGTDAQMPDIARRAGVGVGTVYRHFPTKEALIEAMARDHFARLADDAERAVSDTGDAWKIFAAQVTACATRCANDRGLGVAVSGRPGVMAAAAREETRLRGAMGILIDRARASGQLREDATIDDMPMIMCGLSRVTEMQDQGAPGFAWERYLEIMLDGMRAR